MLQSTLRVSAILFASTLPPLAFAAHTHMATPSTLTLNFAESDFGGGPTMKSDVFVITMDTEKWPKWSDNMSTATVKHGSTPGAAPQTALRSPSPE